MRRSARGALHYSVKYEAVTRPNALGEREAVMCGVGERVGGDGGDGAGPAGRARTGARGDRRPGRQEVRTTGR